MDEVDTPHTTVTALKDEINGLKKKCKDEDGRIRCNVRILGVPEMLRIGLSQAPRQRC